jgi:alpha-tubulin suppressor-like RCC1 family protein
MDDGCGAKVWCGMCQSPESCGGGGVDLVCGVAGPMNYSAVASGGFHSCAIRYDGKLFCWGYNNFGQLGNGTTASSTAPVPVTSTETFSLVAAGWAHTCAVTTGGKLYCWGKNDQGQLGDYTYQSRNVPTLTEPTFEEPNAPWKDVRAGADQTCAKKGFSIYCFGDNSRGQLGLGDYNPRKVPTKLSTGHTVSAGSLHTCVIASSATNDTVFCAGANESYQLGQLSPSQSASFIVAQSPNPFPTWVYVAAGGAHTCAGYLSQLYCWGSNQWGQLGSPYNSGQYPEVVEFSTYGHPWLAVAAGDAHTCAIQTPDKLYCWGANDFGQIGVGSGQGQKVQEPVLVTGAWKAMDLGFSHTCGIKSDGALLCWGDNAKGQLGTGTGSVSTPTPVL